MGRVEKAHKRVIDTLPWVASVASPAPMPWMWSTVVASGGDLAYTAGSERSHVGVDSGRRVTW
jgi:hypothetical protein